MNSGGSKTDSTATQACAACKYQRRKCAPNCLLAPYFPPHLQKDFLNAHKLFGVSNIAKTIRKCKPHQRDAAVKSLIFHATARANDPVWGCVPIIAKLERDLQMAQAELRFVLHQNEMFRAQAAAIQPHPFQVDDILNAEEEFGHDDAVAVAVPVPYGEGTSLVQQDHNLFDGIPVKTETEGSSSSSHKPQFPVLGEEGEPLFGLFDDKDSAAFLHSIHNNRGKAVLKEDVNPVHHEQEHDLKDAVPPFSLTNGKGEEISKSLNGIT
ncbi:LOB domain-containing protein 22-like [Tripterygium wilfordii]|nr:LOB domain-containing protein 22-like [Tripterygium wilfordii]